MLEIFNYNTHIQRTYEAISHETREARGHPDTFDWSAIRKSMYEAMPFRFRRRYIFVEATRNITSVFSFFDLPEKNENKSWFTNV